MALSKRKGAKPNATSVMYTTPHPFPKPTSPPPNPKLLFCQGMAIGGILRNYNNRRKNARVNNRNKNIPRTNVKLTQLRQPRQPCFRPFRWARWLFERSDSSARLSMPRRATISSLAVAGSICHRCHLPPLAATRQQAGLPLLAAACNHGSGPRQRVAKP